MAAFHVLEALEPRQLLSSAILANSRVVKESEPNDDKASADAFVLHQSGNARLKGTFKNNDDRDFFTFTATRSGRMNIKVRGLGGTFAKLEIETAAGVDVFETEPGNGINTGVIRIENGVTYFVRIEKNQDGDHRRYNAKLHLRRPAGQAGTVKKNKLIGQVLRFSSFSIQASPSTEYWGSMTFSSGSAAALGYPTPHITGSYSETIDMASGGHSFIDGQVVDISAIEKADSPETEATLDDELDSSLQ